MLAAYELSGWDGWAIVKYQSVEFGRTSLWFTDKSLDEIKKNGGDCYTKATRLLFDTYLN